MSDPPVLAPAVAPTSEESRLRKIWVRFLLWRRGLPQGEAQPKDTILKAKDTILKEFSAEVGRASVLLDFLMSEGHQYHIPDQIIVEVENARYHRDHPSDCSEKKTC